MWRLVSDNPWEKVLEDLSAAYDVGEGRWRGKTLDGESEEQDIEKDRKGGENDGGRRWGVNEESNAFDFHAWVFLLTASGSFKAAASQTRSRCKDPHCANSEQSAKRTRWGHKVQH